MSRRAILVLIMCGAVFGLSFVFVRAAVPYLGPVALSACRTLIGGTLLLAVVYARGIRRGSVAVWRFALLGVLSAAAPFILLSIAASSLNAGTTAVVNASSPAFALLIEVGARRARITRRKLAGLATALTGVAIATAPRGLGASGSTAAMAVAAALLGALIFAYGGSYAARRFGDVPPLMIASGQQLGAAAVLAPLVFLAPPPGPVDAALIRDVLLLGVLGSALAYLLFYWLIDNAGPVRAASVNLLVPIFGVLWGWLLLGEPLSWITAVGIAVIVIGLRWVLSEPRPS